MLQLKRKKVFVTDNLLWQDLYSAAMLELDRTALQSRIEAARAAIRQAMTHNSETGAGTAADMQAMTDALHNLETLQRVEFRTPAITTTTVTSQPQRAAER
jgi:hypothetical protein